MGRLMDLLIVTLLLPRSKQWEACRRYVMGIINLMVVPMGRGSLQTESPGSLLDVADRTDTE